MKWSKLREPLRVELVHDIDLSTDESIIAKASKDNPVPGIVTHTTYKQIGRNKVCMHLFHPDIYPSGQWSLSRKWFRTIRDSKVD